MKNDFDNDDDTVIILILASGLKRLDIITSAIVEKFPKATVMSSLQNTRPPHERGVRRYVNVFVEEGDLA